MTTIRTMLNEQQHGAFRLFEDEQQQGEMAVAIRGNLMTVYHTEVNPEAEGKGYAKQLLEAMVSYARQHQLKVLPLCPYVHAQFKKHPDVYTDIWLQQD